MGILYTSDKCISGLLKTIKDDFVFTVKVVIDCHLIYIHVPETSKVYPYDVTDSIHFLFDLTSDNVGIDDSRLGCVLSYFEWGTYIELELTDNKELIVHACDGLLFFDSQDEARRYLKRQFFQSILIVRNRRLL